MSGGTLLLVDMAALAFRGHYAFINRPLTRSDGFVTSALFGACSTILAVVEQLKPTHVACAMDTGKPTFRHEMYAAYKANRPPCPPDLAQQLQRLGDLCGALAMPYLSIPGYEADDVIGTLAQHAGHEGMRVVILSGDKDFMQLVDEHTVMMLPQKGDEYEFLDARGVEEKLGLQPRQVVDYLSLLGDASDNVPGAPGVGKVTAAQLLKEHGDLDGILRAAPTLKRKGLATALLENREQIDLSKRLVTIKTDLVDMPALEGLRWPGLDLGLLRPFLKEMEFPKILARLESRMPGALAESPRPREATQYELVKDFGLYISRYTAGEMAAVHVILAPDTGALQALSISMSQGTAALAVFTGLQGADERAALASLAALPVGAHDAKDLLKLVHRAGLGLSASFDTLLQASVLTPGKSDLSLETLVRDRLDLRLMEFAGKGRRQQTFADLTAEEALQYACERADCTRRLFIKQRELLAQAGLQPVLDRLEMPLLPVITGMEEHGIKIDAAMLGRLAGEAGAELDTLTRRIHELAGEAFNINSTQQLGVVLFEKMKLHEQLGLKKVKQTKTGYSTDAAVLEELSGHEMGRALLRYRFLSKLKSTYLDALPLEVDSASGKIHTHYLQNGTATGRISSQRPNLQNIPMRTPEGARIREAFVPSQPNWLLIAADYGQIELRVLAHFCQDEMMLEAFRRGEDIHSATAAAVYGVPLAEVSKAQRSSAKAVNFGLLYGMGPRHLAADTGMDIKEAQRFIKDYFARFPRIRSFMTTLIETAREAGYATTLGGRIRPLPDLNSSNGMLRNMAENMALNTPIQGSAADIIKSAMIRLDAAIRQHAWPLRLLLQVHDELVFECPRAEAERMIREVRGIMEDVSALGLDFSVPLVVDARCGENWLKAH